MRFHVILPCLILVAGLLGAVNTALAEGDNHSLRVTLAWNACPPCDDDGQPLAEAVRYEVFTERNGLEEELVLSVEADTTCTLKLNRDGIYRVRVVGYDADDRSSEPSVWSDPINAKPDGSAHVFPMEPILPPNRPNPFNPATTIAYSVPGGLASGAPMALEVYDIRGQLVRRFPVDNSPGAHEVLWNGTDARGETVGSGIYLTRFVCGDHTVTRKMTMLK